MGLRESLPPHPTHSFFSPAGKRYAICSGGKASRVLKQKDCGEAASFVHAAWHGAHVTAWLKRIRLRPRSAGCVATWRRPAVTWWPRSLTASPLPPQASLSKTLPALLLSSSSEMPPCTQTPSDPNQTRQAVPSAAAPCLLAPTPRAGRVTPPGTSLGSSGLSLPLRGFFYTHVLHVTPILCPTVTGSVFPSLCASYVFAFLTLYL